MRDLFLIIFAATLTSACLGYVVGVRAHDDRLRRRLTLYTHALHRATHGLKAALAAATRQR